MLLARRRPCRVGAEVLHTELVTARPVPQHSRDILVLAAEVARQARGIRLVRVVHAVKHPRAPVRREFIPALDPAAPALDGPGSADLLCDVAELLADVLARIGVTVNRKLPGRHVGADLYG